MTHEICTANETRNSAARRQAFVAAARLAFFRDGYAGTTMSSVARAVGGSKTTLWSYYPSKELLFAAVVDSISDEFADALSIDLPVDEPVETVLRRFGEVLMATLLADPLLALYRLVAGEARRFPNLAELFYERMPRRGKLRLAVYFQELMDRGVLRTGDPRLAAYQFAGLCQCGVYQFAILGLAEAGDPERLGFEIEGAVDSFLRAWRVP